MVTVENKQSYFKEIIFFSVLFLISIIPIIKYLGLIIQVCLFILYYIKKNRKNLALIITLFSTYSSGFSIYSFKIVYILVFFICIVDYKNILHIKISKKYYHLLIFLVIVVFYSYIKNSYLHMDVFFNDLIVLCGVLTGICLFKDVSSSEFWMFVVQLFMINVLVSFFCITTGFGQTSDVDFLGRHKLLVGASESFSIFLFIILYGLFFSPISIFKKSIISGLFVYVIIKAQSFGSMVMLYVSLCFIVLLYLKFNRPKIQHILVLLILVIAVFLFPLFHSEGKREEGNYKAFTYKLENITGLLENFSFSDRSKINIIPLSPYVRLVELINITGQSNLFTFLFGQGLGGVFKDDTFKFESQYRVLGDDDFPIEQREARVFTTAHNIGYPYLKYGLIYFVLIIIISRKIISVNKVQNNNYCKYLAFVFLLASTSYFGFTFQTSMSIGLVFCAFRNVCKEFALL